jgi:ABC-type uncharacterized transport system substrate-binding protein
VNRRAFITLLGGAAAVWPLPARAQQAAMPVIGLLSGLGRNDRPNLVEAFRRGLDEAGYVEGRNVAIEYRFAENQYDRLPALAADLVGRKVAVIVAVGSGNSNLAAKASTTTIPIVFTTGGDPVQEGFVASLNRPGGNLTGISWFNTLLGGKGLGLLHELVPNAAVIALIVNPKNPETARVPSDVQEAAHTLGLQMIVLDNPATERDATWQPIDNTPMHPDHQHCRCGPDRGDIGHGGNPRGGHDQPNRTRCYASLDQHPRLCR